MSAHSDREHIVIVRLAGIGDVVMASAAARRLRDSHHDARITWVTGYTAEPLVRRFADVDAVIGVDEVRLLNGGVSDRLRALLPLWKCLLAARPTHVLLLHLDRRYRALIPPLLRARVTMPRRGKFPLPGRYFGDEYARLADGIGHIGPMTGHYELGRLRGMTGDAARITGRVALVPGGTRNVLRESALKRWPVQHYAAIARALAGDCELVLVGDAHDRWVRPHFDRIQVRDCLGATTLSETLDLLASCELVITHDTGPLHLSRLVRTPVLAVFGPTIPSQFAPDDALTTTLWGGSTLACRPCYDGREFADCAENVCIASIDPEVVIGTARSILRRRSLPTPAHV